jgi:hypothetical protein
MMYGREKSDPAMGKPKNKARSGPQRSRWSEGWGPRGTRTSKARTGHRAGSACHRRLSVYGEPPTGVSPSSPKVRAVCGNSACTDLSGGRSAMSLPYRTSL